MRRGLIAGILIGALVFATGATAATHYIITSTKQVSPKVRNELRGTRGRTGSTGATGAAGARGLTGATGPAGAAGATGATGTFNSGDVQQVTGPTVSIASGQAGGSYASCPSGSVALGGGYQGPIVDSSTADDSPIGNDTAWDVVVANGSSITETITPYAICSAPGAGANALSSTRDRQGAQVILTRQIAALQAKVNAAR